MNGQWFNQPCSSHLWLTNGHWYNQSCPHKEASIKTQKDGVWRLQAGEHVQIWGEWHIERTWDSKPSPYTLLHVSLPSAYFWVMFFYKTCNLIRKLFLWALWPDVAKWSSPRMGSLEPLIWSLSAWSVGDNLGLKRVSEGECEVQPCRTEPLTRGTWCCLWVDIVRIELNCSPYDS